MADETPVSCSKCSAVWQKCGVTNCWSGDPETAPPKPGNCPSEAYTDIIHSSFNEYKGDSEDARLARVAARVEGLCYQKVEGSDAVNARWTRVEDTIAFARLMGWKKIGIAPASDFLTKRSGWWPSSRPRGWSPRASAARRGVSIRRSWVLLNRTRYVRVPSSLPATPLPKRKSAIALAAR